MSDDVSRRHSPVSVRVITLGCKVNQCDGDEIARALAARGYRIARRGQSADCYIVNTCTVTATADAKARKLIRGVARANPGARVIATGCWAQRAPEEAARLPGVSAVVPNTRKREIADLVATMLPLDAALPDKAPAGRTRAFLKVQDGCDHRCAYCAVPDARGRPESKALSQALEEARALAAAGIQELVLCGIRLGAYGSDSGNGGLGALLRALREIDLPRIRLSSVEPMDLKQDLLDEMSDHPRLCHHLHLPLQSGDDAVLAAMNRGYTRSVFADLVSRVRRMWPDVAISTDVMVGFPGETEAQFEATARFAREVGFARLHVFPYSRRPGTPAAQRADETSPEVTRRRAAELLSIAEELSARAAAAWVGREVVVLFEQRAADGRLTGLTEHYLRLRARAPEEWIGRLSALTPHAAARGELLAGDRDAR